MANPDFVKMISLGKWLEKFLDDDIRPWQFRELAREAVTLMKVEYDVNPDNNFFKDIDLVKPKSNEIFLEALGRFLKENKYRNEAGDEFEIIGSKAYDLTLKKGANLTLSTIADRWFEWSNLLALRTSVICLLKEINKSECPWDQVIPKIQKGEYTNSTNPADVFRCSNKITEVLINNYSKLTEAFVETEESLKKRTVIVFIRPLLGSQPSGHFPLDIMLSRIFFDFLLLGGQEYYGFCDYCGKFYVVQRKGRKRFCSDICRTANQKKPLKE